MCGATISSSCLGSLLCLLDRKASIRLYLVRNRDEVKQRGYYMGPKKEFRLLLMIPNIEGVMFSNG